MKSCPVCGTIIIGDICLVCQRTFITPSTLNARLFDLNPHLKKRLEWREKIRRATGIPDLPIDPTKLNLEDLPQKTLPNDIDILRKKKKDEDIEHLEF